MVGRGSLYVNTKAADRADADLATRLRDGDAATRLEIATYRTTQEMRDACALLLSWDRRAAHTVLEIGKDTKRRSIVLFARQTMHNYIGDYTPRDVAAAEKVLNDPQRAWDSAKHRKKGPPKQVA